MSDESVIGATTRIRGNVTGSGSLVVEGTVEHMRRMGADRFDWDLGPCISPAAYAFGAGELDELCERLGPELAATTQFLVQGALQQWLADLITVETVEVRAVDAALYVTVQYVIRRTDMRERQEFVQGAGT